jgi:hypothetical protein
MQNDNYSIAAKDIKVRIIEKEGKGAKREMSSLDVTPSFSNTVIV